MVHALEDKVALSVSASQKRNWSLKNTERNNSNSGDNKAMRNYSVKLKLLTSRQASIGM
jgi:hypothetical protein